ncbi:MAG TPA: GNAT family N-acetyltransferase [Verrucomicrobiae bacterium]|nr:GNAT family N-acetyltransferase [Verrucomicrobiae bacterium]
MTTPTGYTIVSLDLQTATDAEIREISQFRQELALEQRPEDPPTPIEVIAQWLRSRPPGQWRVVFVARDRDGELAGYGVGVRNLKDTQNAHIRWSDIAVKPAHRRRGLGRALISRVIGSFDGQGDGLMVISETTDRVPSGEGFAKVIGAKAGLPMKLNQLDLRTVDRARVDEWSRAAPKGYRLERIDDTVPEELVKPYIEASEGINDMPRGDIAFNDWKLTEAQIRQRESFFKQAGLVWWLLLAVDEQTGEGVGFTEVEFNPNDPHAIQQEGTAVVAAHRGRGIGLWLKAAMLERILADRPDSRFIRTGNANVNAQMLAINEKLGFTYAWQSTLWQLPIAEARKTLAGAEAPARA